MHRIRVRTQRNHIIPKKKKKIRILLRSLVAAHLSRGWEPRGEEGESERGARLIIAIINNFPSHRIANAPAFYIGVESTSGHVATLHFTPAALQLFSRSRRPLIVRDNERSIAMPVLIILCEKNAVESRNYMLPLDHGDARVDVDSRKYRKYILILRIFVRDEKLLRKCNTCYVLFSKTWSHVCPSRF